MSQLIRLPRRFGSQSRENSTISWRGITSPPSAPFSLVETPGLLDVQSYGWKGSRFWPQKRSFSASIAQVLIF
ncbi:hypothetical protein VN97_g9291 [Penicillium thymicola]|uniref:Uncharacterized protein n=1 Tax=Penicillium thymicola TaxID=293382 RepID=A0AAI9TB94_PENTH|nr:hypothetical protein VN97_g9291 [Penicillium thymicola]